MFFSPFFFLGFFDMSYYNRGYRSYGYRSRTGYRRGYNRYWRRNWARQRGVYRSQTAGNRRFNLTVPVSDVFELTTPAGAFWTNVKCLQPYVQTRGTVACGSMVFSPLYRTYSALYDQVKINSVSVKMSILNVIGNGGIISAVKIFTMWDRDLQYGELSAANVPSVLALQNGAESQSSLIVNNSRGIIYRNNRASDIQERTVFHDCSVGRNVDNGYYDGCFANGAGYSHGLGYVPGMFFAIQTNDAPGEGMSYTFNISIEVKWNVTFRNPKYGLTAAQSGAKVSDLKAGVINEIKEEDDLLADDEKKDEEASVDMTDEEVTALLEKLKKMKVSDEEKKDES